MREMSRLQSWRVRTKSDTQRIVTTLLILVVLVRRGRDPLPGRLPEAVEPAQPRLSERHPGSGRRWDSSSSS